MGGARRVRNDGVLLTVAGAPLYAPSELALIERIVHPGDEVAATWVRGHDRCDATATV